MSVETESAQSRINSALWSRLRLGFAIGLAGYMALIIGESVHSRDDFSKPDIVGASIRVLFVVFQSVGIGVLALRALQIGRPLVYDPATMLHYQGHYLDINDRSGASLRGPKYWRVIAYLLFVVMILCIPLAGVMVKSTLRTWD